MLDDHHVIRVPARDDLRGVMLGVQCVHRDHGARQVGERFQQVPHGGDLIRLRVHGDLPEDRADSVGQRRDQVRGLPGLVLRAADGLAVNGDDQPSAGPHRSGVQPGAEDLVQLARADQGERAAEGGLLGRAAGRAQPREHLRAGVGGPLAERGAPPRPRGHRRDPDGQQPGQRMPAAAPLARVRDLGQQLEQVLAAGSSHHGRR
jgi:hypothetical protein